MRKPRDYDSELKDLQDRTRLLQDRKLRQLGELVVATGADALPIEILAGALLSATDAPDLMQKEEWRARGAAFFQRPRRNSGSAAASDSGKAASSSRGAPPAAGS
jgi:hypothetical protein